MSLSSILCRASGSIYEDAPEYARVEASSVEDVSLVSVLTEFLGVDKERANRSPALR